ncbi:MAG: 4Fe-4S dicluster domain-containing protein [Candidatus Bathyarchaeia archaeon]
MRGKNEKTSSVDIFKILAETVEKTKKKRREELLAPLGIKEFFVAGKISINKRICRGVECKLCIKACPTNALYWKTGEVGITEELCMYCGACVINCIVDDCIKIMRKRETNETEVYSKPRDFIILQQNISSKKRFQRVLSLFPKPETYTRKYKSTMSK